MADIKTETKDEFYQTIEENFKECDAFITTPNGEVIMVGRGQFDSPQEVVKVVLKFFQFVDDCNDVPQRLMFIPYQDLEWVLGNGDENPILHLNKRNPYVEDFCKFAKNYNNNYSNN